MTNNILDSYTLVYNITAIPNILFANITKGSEPLSFDSNKLTIPGDLKGQPLELRIMMFKPDGNLFEMSSVMLPSSAAIIAQTAELTGLKMVKKIMYIHGLGKKADS